MGQVVDQILGFGQQCAGVLGGLFALGVPGAGTDPVMQTGQLTLSVGPFTQGFGNQHRCSPPFL